MTVRLATLKDMPWLLEYLDKMGQHWGKTALREKLADPNRLTLIHETGGEDDMFLFWRRGKTENYIGPFGGPAMTEDRWQKPFAGLSVELAALGEVRWPGSRAENRWINGVLWPSAIRHLITSAFGFTEKARPNDEGFTVAEDGRFSVRFRGNTVLPKADSLT